MACCHGLTIVYGDRLNYKRISQGNDSPGASKLTGKYKLEIKEMKIAIEVSCYPTSRNSFNNTILLLGSYET